MEQDQDPKDNDGHPATLDEGTEGHKQGGDTRDRRRRGMTWKATSRDSRDRRR